MTDLKDTNHLSILSWKSKKVPNALILKFQGNRYLGLLRKDKKGQEYWKYHLLSRHSDPEQSGQASSVMDNIEKFQQRQNQTEQLNNYGNNANASEK